MPTLEALRQVFDTTLSIQLTDAQVTGWTTQLDQINAQRAQADLPPYDLPTYMQDWIATQGDQLKVRADKALVLKGLVEQTGMTAEALSRALAQIGRV